MKKGRLQKETDLVFNKLCITTQMKAPGSVAARRKKCSGFWKETRNSFWSFSFLFIFQKPFVERVMDRVTLLVSSTERSLSPSKAVLLYKQLYVLKNFLEYSTVVANHIRVGYAEEFRWVKTVLKEVLVVFRRIWLKTGLPTIRIRSKW